MANTGSSNLKHWLSVILGGLGAAAAASTLGEDVTVVDIVIGGGLWYLIGLGVGSVIDKRRNKGRPEALRTAADPRNSPPTAPPTAPPRHGDTVKIALIVVGGLVVIAAIGLLLSQRTASPAETATPYVDPGSISILSCYDIDTENVSSLVPDDWDAWCLGVESMSEVFLQSTADEQRTTCTGFWETPDDEVLRVFMQSSTSRDEAIGAIDFFWTVC